MEEACLGQNDATLEVVMEAASPLPQGQLEGLGGALLDSWAKPAIYSCSSSAASDSGYLATPPSFTNRSCSAVPFNACGHSPGFLATCDCSCSQPMPSWAMPKGGQAEQL